MLVQEMKCVKELGTRAIDMLEKIGKEEGFSISYILLSYKSGTISVSIEIQFSYNFFYYRKNWSHGSSNT